MSDSSRFLRMLLAAGLLVSLMAATLSPAVAQQNEPGEPSQTYPFQNTPPSFAWGTNAIFYPWVANGEDFGMGSSTTSISVQNLQDRDGQIWIFRGNGDGSWSLATTAALSAYAAKTFTAEQLDITDGAPVAVRGYTTGTTTITAPVLETEALLFVPAGVANAGDDIYVCVANIHDGGAVTGEPYPFMAAVDFTWDGTFYAAGSWVPWANQAELQDILNTVNAGNAGELINPLGGINMDGDCLDATTESTGTATTFWNSLAIGGVAKQAVDGADLPFTSMTDTAVSGYNALNGWEIGRFNEWYLPIVQTNCGPGGCWDSMLRVANMANQNSAITVRFFPADDGSGSLQTGFQVQALVNGGDTWHIHLGSLVPDGWVGSAHIYSDGYVFAMVDRFKVGYSMWITNTASSADWENTAQITSTGGKYVLFAPHVLLDYFGWNTGINVANLYNGDNNVSIQYFNMLGNATQVLNQRLAAHGMTYFYDPSVAAQNDSAQDVVTDPNAGIVGSALIWSDQPVAAAIDATKYPETDPRGGPDLFQATSYSATQNVFTWQAVPLVQKGNPADGMGATSGINIMNPNPTAATANVYWVNPSGFNAQNTGIGSVTIPAFANGFLYTMWQHNLPNGFVGAAQVIANVPVVAVSANVDYQVDGDGSAIFNAFNPCGLYRTVDLANSPRQCSFGDPFDVTGGSVTKYVVDPDGNGVVGARVQIVGDNPAFAYQAETVTVGPDGQATFTNVPVGNYVLNIFEDTLPPYLQLPQDNPQETFTLNEGVDWVETNVMEWNQDATKYVCVGFPRGFSSNPVLQGVVGLDDCDIPLAGVGVAIFPVVGWTAGNDPVVGEVIFVDWTDADGAVSTPLGPGQYALCLFGDEGTTPNGEMVDLDLPDIDVDDLLEGEVGFFCDLEFEGEVFEILPGLDWEEYNFVRIERAELNMLAWLGELPMDVVSSSLQDHMPNQPPAGGVEVCIYHEEGDYDDCKATGPDGTVAFPDAPEGYYVAIIDGEDSGALFYCATGGEFTAYVYFPNCDFARNSGTVELDGGSNGFVCDVRGIGDPNSAELEGTQNGESKYDMCFYYDPSSDLLQDGWSADVDRGSYDVELHMLAVGIIDGFVGIDFVPASFALQSHEGSLQPFGNAEICIEGFGFSYYQCGNVDTATGHIQFTGAPAGEYTGTYNDIPFPANLVCVEGGTETVDVLFPECQITTSHSLNGTDPQPAHFSFFYDPAADINQDGHLDDIGNLGGGGTFDIVIEFESNIG